MTPVLLLDVMGTLVVDPFFEEIPAFFGLDLEQFIAEKHPTAWIDFETGQLDSHGYAARMFRDGRHVDVAALEAHVRLSYRYLDGIEALLEDLAARNVEMHALSNYPRWYRMIDEELALGRFVKWSFVSCRTGYRKPDRAAYSHALEVLGRRPDECLFIDDRAVNCRGAEAVGIPSLLFTDAASLRRGLERATVV